jgi:nucleoid DNA-binding protein
MAKANGGGGGKAKSMTKSQVYDAVAQASEFSRSDVKKFFAALESVVTDQLGKKGPGVVTIPGILKLTAVKKPATKGGERRPNPFKPGEFIVTKPKPASTKVRARALKAFSEALK